MRDPKSGNFFFMAKSGNFGKNAEKGGGSMFSEVLRRRGNIRHNETHTQLYNNP